MAESIVSGLGLSGSKNCRSCQQVKPLDQFNRRLGNRDGLNYYCRDCEHAYKRAARVRRAKEPISVTQKTCIKCGASKPRDDFARGPSTADGLHPYCRACQGYYNRKRRQARALLPIDIAEKRCTRCNLVKEAADFHRQSTTSTGLDNYCRECRKAYGAQHYRANKERHYETVKLWSKRNPEKDAIIRRKARSSDKYKANTKVYREKNREALRETVHKWYLNNREHCTLKKHRRRAKELAGGSFSAKQWRELLASTGNRCLACGTAAAETKLGKLTMDHVIPLSKGGSNTIDNIQPLCLPCNISKARRTIDYRRRAA